MALVTKRRKVVEFAVLLAVATIVASAEGCSSDDKCASSLGCLHSGECGSTPLGLCAPTLAEHCSRSLYCHEEGKCTYDGSRCSVTSEADCEELCSEDGRCVPSEPRAIRRGQVKVRACVVGSERHCQQSRACKTRGLCLLDGGRCVRGGLPDPRLVRAHEPD